MQMNEQDRAIAQRAETLRLSEAYQQAIEIFEQLQKKYPENAWVNAHLGAIYCQLLDYGKAKEHLEKAIANSAKYFWAHAQLGETYRLWAIAEDRKQEYLELSINHFKTALNAETPEDSNYAWALAHLGATYRLEMTRDLDALRVSQINGQIKEEALKCFNRAIELIPTYAWAYGMRATVYRLAQEYEDSYWDLEVETVIAPEIGVLQNSPSPVPFLETKRVNLHEHALLSFYLTKNGTDPKQKDRHYGRAIAFAQQALILQPGDLIAQLILTVIEGNQKTDIEDIKGKLKKFIEDGESKFSELCQKVLRHLIAVKRVTVETVGTISGEEHKLGQLILKDVRENPMKDVDKNPQLWVWKNYALTQTCSIVLFLLSDLSYILKEDSIIGKAEPYLKLATIINRYYTQERLYQTPVLPDTERSAIFDSLQDLI